MAENIFDIQRFADTSAADVAPELIMRAWAKSTYEAGKSKSFFEKFTGTSPDSIIQIKEELSRQAGDTIVIPLLMPLTGAGITGDNELEGNEEQLIYRDFTVQIDQIRNGVRLKGRMAEKQVQVDMRRDAREGLANWLATYIDKKIFEELSTDPTPDRIVYGGSATSEGAIGAADVFDTTLIGKAKRIALADENTMVKPIRINGNDTYIMVIDQWQARDLTSDEKWIAAQQHANIRGEKNPIFSGALGVYDGVVLHQCNRVIRTDTGSGGTKVGHALFLGAQAAVFAEGAPPTWQEKFFDYNARFGVSFGRIFGIKKTQFKYDGENLTDFGCINVLTASEDDSN
ncbi:MAG: N4-gp56 family major capsid protein [Selenomonadaceae bacterium]|nr:N4-gp56 family major capsid protein [Selenomonadaceae bacterium]